MKPSHFNRENLTFALTNILAHKFRSLLTILGIIVGIVTVILVASVLVGVRANVALLFQEFGPNNIFAFHLQGDPANPRVKPEDIARKPLRVEFARQIVADCPSVRDAAAQILVPNVINNRAMTARYRDLENENIQLQGATWNFPKVTNTELQSGRMYTAQEEQRQSRVCVLGANVTTSLFPSEEPLGKSIQVDGAIYQVIGVFEKRKGSFFGENRQDNVVMIPVRTIQSRYPEAENVVMYCEAAEGRRESALGEIEAVLRRLRRLKSGDDSDFVLSTADSIIQQFDRVTVMIRTGTLVISSLGLLVGGVGVMNIMLMSVTQRTREIGIRKAVGARRRDITWQFLLEAALLATIGGMLGIALAFALGLVLTYFVPNLPAIPPMWAVTSGLGVSTLVGMVFGVWPAVKAARLDPVESLRYE